MKYYATVKYTESIMQRLLELLQVNSAMHQWLRTHKDAVFLPVAKFCARLGVSASAVTCIGWLIGIASIGLLFVNYWYFAVGILVSTLADGVDGALARSSNTVTKSGAQLDYAVDLSLTLLTYSALTYWLQEPLWVFGLNLFGMVLLFNWLAHSPIRIAPGRMGVVSGIIVGLPQVGLFLVSGYAVLMYGLLLIRMIGPHPHPFSSKEKGDSKKH